MSTTKWFENAIIYHILIDRFAGFPSTQNWETPTFLGGTIQGITKKLPYLNNLGITTVWISPFYHTSAYHGYHITDFYQVDPRYGTLQNLKELIKKVHDYNMHLIADFVPNHCLKEHPFFRDAQQNQNSPYSDWFYFLHWPNDYKCFLSIKDIPKINLENKEARKHIITAADHWLNQGLDGYRLDHVIGPSHSFWKDFTTTLKNNHPSCVLIGEAWMQGIKRHELQTLNISHKYFKWFHGSVSDALFKDYIGELDGLLDFRVQQLIRSHVIDNTITESKFFKQLHHHYSQYPNNFFLPTFLDNHDMDRFLFLCQNDVEKLQKAARLQFSLPQPAIIYYGNESGVTQTKSIWKPQTYGDLQARQPMNWDHQNTTLQKFYTQLIHEKKN